MTRSARITIIRHDSRGYVLRYSEDYTPVEIGGISAQAFFPLKHDAECFLRRNGYYRIGAHVWETEITPDPKRD